MSTVAFSMRGPRDYVKKEAKENMGVDCYGVARRHVERVSFLPAKRHGHGVLFQRRDLLK